MPLADLRRLTARAVLCVVGVLASAGALAQSCLEYRADFNSAQFSSAWLTSKEAAVADLVNVMHNHPTQSNGCKDQFISADNYTNQSCVLNVFSSEFTFSLKQTKYSYFNGTGTTTTAILTGGQIVQRSATCPPRNLCAAKAGQAIGAESQGFTVKVSSYVAPKTLCQELCTATIGSPGIFSSKDGQKYFNGFDSSLVRYDGTACQPAEVAAPEPAPAPCPAKQCPGTVNGAAVCVPCDENATVKKTVSSKTLPDGSTEYTERTETTTCTGSQCTTKVEIDVRVVPVGGPPPDFGVEDPNGQSGEETEQEEPSSFCEDNPGSPLCKASSFNGSCGSFTCDGDAVQCAIARDQHATNCKLLEVPAGVAETMQGLTGEGPASPAFLDSIGLTLPTAPANTCAIDNFSISLFQGHTLEVPLGDRICGHMGVIRGVITAFGMLAFVMIVFRG